MFSYRLAESFSSMAYFCGFFFPTGLTLSQFNTPIVQPYVSCLLCWEFTWISMWFMSLGISRTENRNQRIFVTKAIKKPSFVVVVAFYKLSPLSSPIQFGFATNSHSHKFHFSFFIIKNMVLVDHSFCWHLPWRCSIHSCFEHIPLMCFFVCVRQCSSLLLTSVPPFFYFLFVLFFSLSWLWFLFVLVIYFANSNVLCNGSKHVGFVAAEVKFQYVNVQL